MAMPGEVVNRRSLTVAFGGGRSGVAGVALADSREGEAVAKTVTVRMRGGGPLWRAGVALVGMASGEPRFISAWLYHVAQVQLGTEAFFSGTPKVSRVRSWVQCALGFLPMARTLPWTDDSCLRRQARSSVCEHRLLSLSSVPRQHLCVRHFPRVSVRCARIRHLRAR